MTVWKSMTGALALAAVMAAPTGVLAQDPSDERAHEHLEEISEKLDLRKEQKEQLKAHHKAMKEQHKALREQSKNLRRQMREAVRSGADQSTLDSLGSRWGKVQASKMQMMHRHKQSFEKVLDPEQKAKLEKLMAEKKKRWKEKHGEEGE